MRRKPGETIQELAARIRQDATTCGFSFIKDPLDEALHTRFICSVRNEVVLKALFKFKADELTLIRAVEIAIETEEPARVAKETVYGDKTSPVNKVKQKMQRPESTSAKPTTASTAARPTTDPAVFVTCKDTTGTFWCLVRATAVEHRTIGQTIADSKKRPATCRHCQKVGYLKSLAIPRPKATYLPERQRAKSQ